MSTNLTLTHLRFDVIARNTIKLGREEAGNRLRNALASVMLRTVCPERKPGVPPLPEHVAICPACWLLAANVDAGKVRRAYSLVPPIPPRDIVQTGERFSFVLTLYGEGFNFLPYFVLAVPEMGQGGVGPGRGQFELEAIWAADPLTQTVEAVLRPGEQMVYLPKSSIGWQTVHSFATKQRAALEKSQKVQLRFLTPTRLVNRKKLVKVPDFGVFFQRMLNRIDQLGQQFAGDKRRNKVELDRLHQLANQVRLMETRTRWIDLWSWSGRTRKKSPMGGFVGWATYQAIEWDELLPWILLGQGTHTGKSAVKGNGVFEMAIEGQRGYWEWLFAASLS